jgi:membrane-bound lytic murein transglycosylase B
MRKRLLMTGALVLMLISPMVTIAEPGTLVKQDVSDQVIVENIMSVIEPKVVMTKDEIAAQQIEENLQKIEEAKKATVAPKPVKKTVIRVEKRTNFWAVYRAAGAKYGVHPAILAAVHYKETGGRGNTAVGSYAGARGPMQFMPSTFAAYAQDGDGDGIKNIYDVDDAIFTAARYLAANKVTRNISGALYRYNHSTSYVYSVIAIARGYGYTG